MSVHEKKAALIKTQVLQSTLKLLGKRTFKDLYVDEICADVKISKVTFFKYFPQKEDVLLYYYRHWCLVHTIKTAIVTPEGLTRIKLLLDEMVNSYKKHPGIILGLISYLTSLGRPAAPFPLKPIERQLLFPDIENINDFELLSLPQLFEKHLLDAIFQNQIRSTGNAKELAHLFLSTLYGSLITCHLRQVDNINLFVNRNYDLLIKGLNS